MAAFAMKGRNQMRSKRTCSKAILRLQNLEEGARRRNGQVYAGAVAIGHNADVCPGTWVRLHGVETNRSKYPFAYDRTFQIGDSAEYDSYNLHYIGRIVAIGKATVTIEHRNRRRRLSFYEFSYRNRPFAVQNPLERLSVGNRLSVYR